MYRRPPSPPPFPYTTLFRSMAEHESRHYGALAMVAGLLESAPQRTLPAAPALTRAHVVHLRELLDHAEAEARGAITLARRSEEHTSELQSLRHLVCRLLLEK